MTLATGSQDEFQQEDMIDVRPFLDTEDGGSLDQSPSLSMSTILIFLVTVFVLILISQKFASFFYFLTRKSENKNVEQVLISDLANKFSLDTMQVLQRLERLGIAVKYETRSNREFISLDDCRQFENDLRKDDPVFDSTNKNRIQSKVQREQARQDTQEEDCR